jgi:hypothetical protein
VMFLRCRRDSFGMCVCHGSSICCYSLCAPGGSTGLDQTKLKHSKE